ncbi:MAG: 2-amino-4-hydroxy-6-hydroxymethyldihydropteridine diphosphokinase [bacterium]|nr:2-amino-4-hydroxy-6-hydroxymethyldihydropteridine diphosphokinase [bacterium]
MDTEIRDAVLLLGSNLGERKRHLENAIAALSSAIEVTALSRIYESEPFGLGFQPWFLNVALRGGTTFGPHELLRFVKKIEKDEGRTEDGERWGPRPLDIDIILMDGMVVRDNDLTVPHASMAVRRFCLLPVAEIAGDFRVPPHGATVRELLERCKDPLEVYPL